MTEQRVVQSWSKSLFNNAHFLRVAASIGRGAEEIDAPHLQASLGLSQSAVRRVILDLEAVDLLHRVERESRTSPLTYRREPHPFWDAADALLESAQLRKA